MFYLNEVLLILPHESHTLLSMIVMVRLHQISIELQTSQVIDYYQHTALERQSADAPLNPMCNIFPTVVSCDLKTIGTSGGEQNWNGLCILSQNIINQWVHNSEAE